MQRAFLFLPLIISMINVALGQNSFSQGYFINHQDVKTQCLINNNQWKSTPDFFEYKLTPDESIHKAGLAEVKEFGIGQQLKYVSALVNIDRSDEDINALTYNRNPVFEQEQLFLKVLLEGEASLYQYRDKKLERYFFSTGDGDLQQLVYKSYLSGNQVYKNTYYQQQLLLEVFSDDMQEKQIERVRYTQNDLVKHFALYNESINAPVFRYEDVEEKDLFNFSIKSALGINKLHMEPQKHGITGFSFEPSQDISWLGVELEYFIPGYGKKWSLTFEPRVYGFIGEASSETDDVMGGVLNAHVEYFSVEIPLGVRYYFMQKNKHKLFVNGQIIYHNTLNSSRIYFTRNDGSRLNGLAHEDEFYSNMNVGFGLGYKFYDRAIIEVRYYTPRQLLTNSSWNSKYNRMAVLLGFTLF